MSSVHLRQSITANLRTFLRVDYSLRAYKATDNKQENARSDVLFTHYFIMAHPDQSYDDDLLGFICNFIKFCCKL